MPSIFTRIINGEIPCYKVAEDEKHLAFLDINPVMKGHVLVIPKQEIDYIFDLEDETLKELMVFAKKVALAIEKVVSCNRISVGVFGLEVPHAHVHLIPMNTMADVSFAKPKLKLTRAEFQELATEIQANITL